MAAREDVELKYRADISQLVSKLKSIEGITDKEAKAMAKSLDRGFKQATKAANRAAKATRAGFKKAGSSMKAAGDAAKDLGDSAGDADTALGGIASGLGLISPEAEKATRVLQDMFAATEGVLRSGASVARVLGPVAVAVAAAGAAWHKYKGELDKANEASREASKMATLMADKHLRVKDAILLAEVATGKLTRADYERQSAMMQAKELFKDDIELARKRRVELDRQIAATKIDIALAQEAAEGREMQARSTRRLTSAAAAYGGAEGDVRQGITDVMGHTQNLSKVRTEAANRTKLLTEKVDQLTQKRDLAKTQIQNLEAAVESYGGSLATVATVTEGMTEATRELIEAQAGLQAMIEGANQTIADNLEDPFLRLLAAEERINREYQESLALLAERSDLAQNEALAAEARAAIELERESKIAAARKEAMELSDAQAAADEAAAADRLAVAEKERLAVEENHQLHLQRQRELSELATAAHEQRMTDLMEEADAIASSVASTIGSVEDLAALSTAQHEADAEAAMKRADEFAAQGLHNRAAAERKKAEGFREAALEAHKLGQVAAYGQIAIDTAMGINRAQAVHAGRPIAAAAATAAVVAAGIAATAAVAAAPPPAFDIGGMVAGGGIVSRSHDSVSASLRPGEGVLTAQGVQAVGGPAGIHAANRGQPQVTVVPIPTYKHLGGLFTADEVARRGPLRRALDRAGARTHNPGRRGY